MYAFRCKHCGRLHHGEHAGENSLPHACTVCGRGVVYALTLDDCLAHPHAAHAPVSAPRAVCEKFHSAGNGGRLIALPFGVKFLHHENWEVLADASEERLAELGLAASDVKRHVPLQASGVERPFQHVSVNIDEGAKTEDVVQ